MAPEEFLYAVRFRSRHLDLKPFSPRCHRIQAFRLLLLGGLVGIGGYPSLIDGGSVTAPHMGIWFPNGKWDVENVGVAPDVEVDFDPKAVRNGGDPQLDKAIEIAMAELAANPVKHPKRPAFPEYHGPKKETSRR